jgi:hypothetical protein
MIWAYGTLVAFFVVELVDDDNVEDIMKDTVLNMISMVKHMHKR